MLFEITYGGLMVRFFTKNTQAWAFFVIGPFTELAVKKLGQIKLKIRFHIRPNFGSYYFFTEGNVYY